MDRKTDPFPLAETKGNLDRTASGLGFEDVDSLLQYLKGKVVLDVGSGLGGFAKQAYEKLGSGTRIISMGKFLGSADQKDEEKEFDIEQQFSLDTLKRYQETAVTANWKKLPFAPETFDSVFATGSFLFYTHTYDDDVLLSFIHLLKKETGELRIELGGFSPQAERAMQVAKSNGCEVIFQSMKYGDIYLIIRRGKQ